jgi:hypothetical protein
MSVVAASIPWLNVLRLRAPGKNAFSRLSGIDSLLDTLIDDADA